MSQESPGYDRHTEQLLARHAQQQLKLGVFALYAHFLGQLPIVPSADPYLRDFEERRVSFAHAELPLVPSWLISDLSDSLSIERFNLETQMPLEYSSLRAANEYKASGGRRKRVLQHGFNTEQYDLLSTQAEELIEAGLDVRHERYTAKRLPNNSGDLVD